MSKAKSEADAFESEKFKKEPKNLGQAGSRFMGSEGRGHSILERAQYVPGSDGTYAQNYQDTWLQGVAKLNGWEHAGFFLDLGAFKGLECSNTALVEKTFGWKGACVEPRPAKGAFAERTCSLVERPLSGASLQDVRFYGTPGTQLQHINKQQIDLPEDAGELLKSISVGDLLSCLDEQGRDFTPKKDLQLSSAGRNQTLCDKVPAAGQRLIIPSFINFVSLDVEGQERNLLSSWPWDKVKVGAWVIEMTGKEKPELSAIQSLMQENGYKQVPVENPGVDTYFIHAKLTKYEDRLNKKEWRDHPEGSNGC